MPHILVMDDLSERDIRADDGHVRRISLLLLRMEAQYRLFCSVCCFAQFVVLLSLLFYSVCCFVLVLVSIFLTNIFGQM